MEAVRSCGFQKSRCFVCDRLCRRGIPVWVFISPTYDATLASHAAAVKSYVIVSRISLVPAMHFDEGVGYFVPLQVVPQVNSILSRPIPTT